MKTGKIIITDKVYFEYYKKEEPDGYVPDGYTLPEERFEEQMKAYEASKQLVEVNNVEVVYEWPDEVENPNDDKIYGYSFNFHKPDEKGNTAKMIINNQPCKAEIKDNKATIIELI